MDSIVIKVKYEKTLRRFNASVVDGRLVLDTRALRAKIVSLFHLSDDAEFTLRYTDEDGDAVTLADDEDLLDVVKQSLNPLRITVKLNSEMNVKKNESGNSTPTTVSPQKQPLSDILKSLIHEAFKLLQNTSVNNTSYPQALAELVDNLQKQVLGLKSSAESSPKSGGASGSNPDLSVKKDSKVSQVSPWANSNSGITNSKGRFGAQVPLASAKSISDYRDKVEKAVFSHAFFNPDELVKKGSLEPSLIGWPIVNNQNKIKENSPNPFSVGNGGGFSQYARQTINPFNNVPRGISVHRGIECDVCGAHPITGTRFKSVVKHNYDLCNACFEKEGNAKDYMRFDWPLPLPGTASHHVHQNLCPMWPRVSSGDGSMRSNSKMDSIFIQDVNILDGTIMSPATPFTKIWRMKNNGTFLWPRGTQLMWIGGDKFTNIASVELEIPATGFPMGKELDVAVEFTAPLLPGRYISYWRMALPSGQKFGQRVWVLIQVDSSLDDAEVPKEDQQIENSHNFNLNLPPPFLPINSSINVPQIVNVNKDKEVLVEPLVEENDDYKSKDNNEEINFPINNTLLVGHRPAEASSSSTVSYPVVDFSKIEPIAPFNSPAAINLPVPPVTLTTTTTTTTTTTKPAEGDDEVEQKLLKDLEEMGFKQMDLNKEILKKNDYDLQLSIDDLCGFEDWDPMHELKDLGFLNDEVNKKLLKKHNGSIKRCVMDLINGEYP